MDNLDAEARLLNDQARRFAEFTGIVSPAPNDRFVLVMGMTGSGKSTFIAKCTEQPVGIGHGLKSYTNDVDVFSFQSRGIRTYLIDTPGFNDTNRLDVDTLGTLASYLAASYANGVRIHGVVMLHPISDNRMRGSSLRNIEMIKAICGFTHYANFAIATTMWPDDPDPEHRKLLEDREAELQADSRFFGSLITGGAVYFRSSMKRPQSPADETASARHIVEQLTNISQWRVPPVLKLQRQLVDHGMTLEETDGGRIAAGELYETRRECEQQLRELKSAMQSTLAQADAKHAAAVRELQQDLESKLTSIEEAKTAMERSVHDLHKREKAAWQQRFASLEQQYLERVEAKEQELRDMEESLTAIRRDMSKQSKRSQNKPQERLEAEEHEEMVKNARKEAGEARAAHQGFRAQIRANVVNGAVNGITAGTLSGIIAAVAAGGLLCNVM